MACENQVGVKNIMLTFIDCETQQQYGPISHQLANDEMPAWRTCGYSNESMPGGFVKRTLSNAGVELSVIRDLRIPLAMYQGCSDVAIQVEYYNGLVYSAIEGTGVGDERSDAHEVTLDITFKEIDELLPAGELETTTALAA